MKVCDRQYHLLLIAGYCLSYTAFLRLTAVCVPVSAMRYETTSICASASVPAVSMYLVCTLPSLMWLTVLKTCSLPALGSPAW